MKDRTVRVDPRHLSLQFITDSQVSKLADEFGVNIEPLYTELWKHVIVTEIIKFRYGSEPDRSIRWRGFLDGLRKDKAKKSALQYIENYGDTFWISTEDVVKEKINETDRRIQQEMEGSTTYPGINVKGNVGTESHQHEQIRLERTERFKRIVGEHQLSNLDQILGLLADEIRASTSQMFVVIDDLDDDWVDHSMYRQLVMALFRTVRELGRFEGIKVVVAVRNNILRYLDFEEAGTGQREKYETLLINLRWTSGELMEMLDLRAKRLAQETNIKAVTGLVDLLPKSSQGGYKPTEFIINHTLMRPRDAIDLINRALEPGSNDMYIKWDSLKQAIRGYSASRLDAVVDEWKLVYPDLRWTLEQFWDAPARLSREQVDEIFFGIAIEANGQRLKPVDEFTEDLVEVSPSGAWDGPFRSLAAVLFEVGFLGVNLDANSPGYVFSFDEPDYLVSRHKVDQSGRFEIHRAFHSALGIQSSMS